MSRNGYLWQGCRARLRSSTDPDRPSPGAVVPAQGANLRSPRSDVEPQPPDSAMIARGRGAPAGPRPPMTSAADLAAGAATLAATVRFLPWSERAAILDQAFWAQAEASLDADEVTALANRGATGAAVEHTRSFARRLACLAAAVLELLDEEVAVAGTEHALTLLLSLDEGHKARALDWLDAQPPTELGTVLAALPGYAFALMALYPNDCARGFLARDAFWRALHGAR
jgi:hypothetical protein